eukprot:TRINITY_DN4845_c0_g1_i3.p1 TRINITY_DN4845_c0_g1~~TRINITY_DN4845_c0_g1_i3.p1  ORF type:complete len:135 (-),score=29.86 TRINITY_DN4845_c0_g1_i3:110-514(-)
MCIRDRYQRRVHGKLETYVPQMRVLKKASAFITHGGAGGVMEALSVGCPLICVPMVGDQAGNAEALDKLKLGMHLKVSPEADKTVTTEQIRASIKEIAENPEYKENCLRYQSEIDPVKSREQFYNIVMALLERS